MKLERLLEGAKNLVRTGWMQNGIPSAIGETVASHSFEASILAYVLSTELKKKGVEIDPEHSAVIALFHDAGETLLGDLPKWTTNRINKRDAEIEAFDELGVGKELFLELKELKTNEAKVAKLSDRLSTYLQGLRYKRLGFNVDEIISSYAEEIDKLLSIEPLNQIKELVTKIMNSLNKVNPK
ncbi:HD domain-containing protein [Sulfolobus sp. E5-1-F]|uniref:HD domain-containing protein n=1 Tax=Sulfolobaceae TaxID=118883 RepID=UPI001294FEB2|nr:MULTISPECIES: HD family hydrolase [unclassified Sulfolobus]QGA53535.1 HD domain-containing protein [Sulfolobus sp. E5-1-F]QGA68797.1 HD domain-containing protein [Sulfolobus sp. E11-6]